jgi:hypothetical protein
MDRLVAIKRTARVDDGWTKLLSESLHDWYDPEDSQDFTKETLEFTSLRVVVEAT